MNLRQGCFGVLAIGSAAFAMSLSFQGCAQKKMTVSTVYSAQSTFEPSPKTVILVSFDGLRPDAIEAAGADHIRSLAEAGVRAKAARTIDPAITLPSHSSMISGVTYERHGINWNDWRPEKGTIGVPTMFDEAKRKGLTTAMIASKEKFKHFDRPGTIDHVVLEYGDPYDVAVEASEVIRKHRPNLVFIHFGHPDQVGHDKGWMSKAQLDVIDDADQALGILLHTVQELGMASSTAIIVTADHGGTGKGHFDGGESSTSIPWIAAGAGIPARGTLEKPLMTYDTAATAVKLLGLDVPASWDGVSAFD